MSDSTERRHEPERRSAARVKTDGSPHAELVMDVDSAVQFLSPLGMRLRVELPLEAGSRHRFTLTLDNADVEVSGIVRDCQPSPAGRPGFDVNLDFEELEPAARAGLEAFASR